MRSGLAPQALAAIRDRVLNYSRQTGQKPRPKAFAKKPLISRLGLTRNNLLRLRS